MNTVAEVDALAQAVATELTTLDGKEWTMLPNDAEGAIPWYRFLHTGQEQISLEIVDAKKRRFDPRYDYGEGPLAFLGVQGDYPPSDFYPSILALAYISVTKSPLQIAREIQRRVLVDYRVALADLLERIAEQAHIRTEQTVVFLRLAEISGTIIGSHESACLEFTESVAGGEYDLAVRYRNSEPTVDLDLTVAPAVAESILRMLHSEIRMH